MSDNEPQTAAGGWQKADVKWLVTDLWMEFLCKCGDHMEMSNEGTARCLGCGIEYTSRLTIVQRPLEADDE